MGTSLSASRKQRMRILLVLFVVLGIGAVLVFRPFGTGQKEDKDAVTRDPAQRELVAADKDAITAFEIKPKDEDAFKIAKEGEQWFVIKGDMKYHASQERVDKLLEELPHLRSEALVTENIEKYKDLEVDDAAAIMLGIYTGADKPAVQLSVGKSGPGYSTAFVRMDGGKEVYRANKNVRTLVGFAFTDWRNKTPWAFDISTATEISLAVPPAKEEAKPADPAASEKDKDKPAAPAVAVKPGPVSTYKKVGEIWQTADGRNAGQNAIKELLKGISEISINQFIDEPDNAKTALDGAQPCLTITTPTGKLSLTLGAKELSQYYAKDQDGVVYQLAEYALRSYLELDMATLNLDDTPKDEAKPEGDKAAGDDSAPKEEKEPTEGSQEDKKSETDE